MSASLQKFLTYPQGGAGRGMNQAGPAAHAELYALILIYGGRKAVDTPQKSGNSSREGGKKGSSEGCSRRDAETRRRGIKDEKCRLGGAFRCAQRHPTRTVGWFLLSPFSFLLSPFSFLLSPFSFLLSPFSFLLSPFSFLLVP